MDHHVFYRGAVGLCACVFALFLARRVSAETLDEAVQRELRAIRESRAVEEMQDVWNITEGCLAEGASAEELEQAKDLMTALHNGAVKDDLALMAAAAFAELNKPAKRSLGVWTLTAYCNCSICCGKWAGGGTASGTTPTAGRTVAADLPFSTKLEINGHEYIVEDRGVSGAWVDIYFDTHAEAVAFGLRSAEVFIID